MELYLVRHAIAAERGPAWPDDDLRPLTDRGRSKYRQAVAGFATLDIPLDQVLSSPLIRARETAALLASGLPEPPPVSVLDVLAPGHAPLRVLEALSGVTGNRIALVGHEPSLSRLAAFLIGSRRGVPFRKGGMCRIHVESLAPTTTGTLVWHLTPGLLRRLAA